MRLPWQKTDNTRLGHLLAQSAVTAVADAMDVTVLADHVSQRPDLYCRGASEMLCFVLHLCDRDLFGLGHNVRQTRMDAAIPEVIRMLALVLHDRFELPLGGAHDRSERLSFSMIRPDEYASAPDALSLAANVMLAIYEQRMAEYAACGEDWLRKASLKLNRHMLNAVCEDGDDFQVFMVAAIVAQGVYASMLQQVPECFRR